MKHLLMAALCATLLIGGAIGDVRLYAQASKSDWESLLEPPPPPVPLPDSWLPKPSYPRHDPSISREGNRFDRGRAPAQTTVADQRREQEILRELERFFSARNAVSETDPPLPRRVERPVEETAGFVVISDLEPAPMPPPRRVPAAKPAELP